MRSYLQIIAFILLNFTAGCGAVHVVHKSINETVQLRLKNTTDLTILKWRKNQHLIATFENEKPDVQLTNKYDINSSNGTLIIKHLTLNDSGIYQAQSGKWETLVIKYHLKVHEVVPEPLIKNIIDHQSNFTFCHMLVQCSADKEWVVYDCNLQQCTPINISLTKLTMTIHIIKDKMLECLVSNHGSKKRTSIPWDSMCPDKHRSETNETKSFIFIFITCFAIVFIGLIFTVVKIIQNSKKKVQNEGTFQQDGDVNTIYSVVNKPRRTVAPTANSAEQSSPTTVYDYPSTCAPQNAAVDSSQKDDGSTVYWKLGQKHQP